MNHPLYLFNTLTRQKEQFLPLHPPFAGMYVCGPTVYSEPHLGHIRMAITFDILFRYLRYLGYKVRYVRNITDVGHLEDEAMGEGEDRIARKARLEELEPMEIVQKYRLAFQQVLEQLNILPPSIEPTASGHIIEQQQMIEKIIAKGYAYEVAGSVYFDIETYNRNFGVSYGSLSGRKIDDMLANTRSLQGQTEKRSPLDFALWKKAGEKHIMQWPSPWGMGFPGWHLECSAMGTKYLGETFDIHGGGLDLMFPHHECEIAQSTAANGKSHVRYWVHNNMITIDGQKMARSLNNFITLCELFSGSHPKLSRAYSPMTVKFFVLTAHYRSTLDFSDEALQSAEKGYERLMKGVVLLDKITPSSSSGADLASIVRQCHAAINDDLNYPVVMARLFDMVKMVNSASTGSFALTAEDIGTMKELFHTYLFDIFGLKAEDSREDNSGLVTGLMELVLSLRHDAKSRKDYQTADIIRDALANLQITVNDTREGAAWEIR